ncbi:uncharacterized protein LOC126574824 [Anopheles aquasalis]|uniref:uncharacterized protein LOC126574824 n=1 Tax=Anopheles aquasalis TaxID=42839 RepID=UPI00215AE1D1|nr:uncharacterized protein LOC126574824 [Anopheles aquasalis]XP_050091167.1 uncharacterized protein LOC126574824 [Anopheles aquasalis]XP_050091168.1 uncharacterized protein LOC126574824 [Anopheles aquasalis]
MDGSPPKANRKVRFSLPEPAVPAAPASNPVQKQRMAHGTMQYVNGTLISQQTTGQSRAGSGHTNNNHHQTLQVTATATTIPGVSSAFKPKELNNKIVLHLRPSVSSLDGSGGSSGSELSPKGGSGGSSMDLVKSSSSAKQKALGQKGTSGSGTTGTGGSRSLKTLPHINQKFPSSEDVNNNTGGQSLASCGTGTTGGVIRQKTSDDLSTVGMWNHPTKKPTLILRTISSTTTTTATSVKPFSARSRTKSVGKLPVGNSIAAVRSNKTLISPHLQPLDAGGGGVMIRVHENGKAPEQPATNGAPKASPPVYGKNSSNFLAVPEYSDRYEGMETVVSVTPHDEVEEDEFEDSEQEETQTQKPRTGGKDSSADSGSTGGSGSISGLDFRCTRDTNLGRDKNSAQFWDFVERWRTNRALKKLEGNHGGSGSESRKAKGIDSADTKNGTEASRKCPSDLDFGASYKPADAKSPTLSSRIRALRMSLEQVPTVTTLLRASRDANEYLLKEVFRDILENGISKENLNSTDRSGRTAISYICSTNLTNFLELFLQLPGIDVNKPDNEGNTPLHFAAQAGLSDVVNMLITKCRSLVIDPKNNLGFTPLMKAALQGRTRCAKLLLFAGASPVETDAGRGFRAEQWARFCGRHTCAETIEQCARARLLDKSTPCGRWSHDINLPVDKNALKARSCSITPQPTQNGFRSKFRKVFPFNFNSSKEKPVSKEGEENYTKDLVNYLKSATLCVSGPALSANRKIIQSLIRPLEVPKLEVTYANNNALIKKYEASGCGGTENGHANGSRRHSVDGSTADSRHATPQQSPVPTPRANKVRN